MIGSDGFLYVHPNQSNNQLYRINLTTRVATSITMSQAAFIADLGWVGGLLYGVDSDTGQL